MAEDPYPTLRSEVEETLTAVLSGERRDVAVVSSELGLTSLDVARAMVSYALSPSYGGDLDITLEHFRLTRDDFYIATLLASAEWEDDLKIVERLHQVYEEWPKVRPILAQVAYRLAIQNQAESPKISSQSNWPDASLLDTQERHAVISLTALLPAGFKNIVLRDILKQTDHATAISPVQHKARVPDHIELLHKWAGLLGSFISSVFTVFAKAVSWRPSVTKAFAPAGGAEAMDFVRIR